MTRLEMENYNMVLTKKQQKYQHFHQVKLINRNIFQVKKYYLLIKIEQQKKLSALILLYKILLKYKTKNKKTKTKKTIEDTAEKQSKTIEDATEKQTRPLETLIVDQNLKSFGDLFSKDFFTIEARDEIEKSINIEQEVNRDYLYYKTGKKKKSKTYYLQKFKTIISFGTEIYNSDFELNDAFKEQIKLKNQIDNFNQYTKPKSLYVKEEKVMNYKNANRPFKGKKVFKGFESKIFPKKQHKEKILKY